MQELIISPPLEHGGRIYRHGITSTAGRIPLGAVDVIISDEIPLQLRMEKVDQYKLKPTGDGRLICDVFWEAPNVCTTSHELKLRSHHPTIHRDLRTWFRDQQSMRLLN